MTELNTAEFAPEGLEIAVIGMAVRLPGASTVEAFWHNLRNGVESITFFNDDALQCVGVPPETLRDPTYVRAAAQLDHYDCFDAAFFGFSPRDAELTDPQQRVFLECCWEALESAGCDPEHASGPIGVYAGAGMNWYFLTQLAPLLTYDQYHQVIVGNDKDYLATRVSYKLNLCGPSMTVQTACSTSLVAVHLACQDLLNYRCDVALAGGATVLHTQDYGYHAPEGSIYSPDGHCRAFDAQAKGTIFGSGVAVVVLKRLTDALAAGDVIDAIIKGSAINNDGASKVGYTAPSMSGQAQVIMTAQTIAGVHPDTITYVEAHGTATPLGDPIELAALTQAFRTRTQRQQFCAIGSLKSNVGHLDTAAGVAGLIKTVLALKHREMPPSLHFECPNPEIDLTNSPFFVNTRLHPWHTSDLPRRAGVSSFGIGGTNAHVILEEAPALGESGHSRPWQLLLLSAKTPAALECVAQRLATYLQQHPACDLADVAYTLQIGRRAFDHRRFVVCRDREEALRMLETGTAQPLSPATQTSHECPVVFLFPGQGGQDINMGRELYHQERVFRECIDHCAAILETHVGCDVRDVLFPSHEQHQRAAQDMMRMSIAQPAVFIIEYALAQQFMAWGVTPHAMIGHSLGEYTAACIANVLTLEDTLQMVAVRGQLMEQLPVGAMLAVPLSAREIESLLDEQLALAAINGPATCVVAGSSQAIAVFAARLEQQGVDSRLLRISRAAHSPATEQIVEAFARACAQVQRHPPTIPYISTVTGTWISDAQATDPHYWTQHLRQQVQFGPGLETLLRTIAGVFLEVGPGQTLSTLVKQHPATMPHHVILTSLRQAQQQQSDIQLIQTILGQLWLAGVPVAWSALYQDERRQRVRLPTYPFERQRYWMESPVPPTNTVELHQPNLTPVPAEQAARTTADELEELIVQQIDLLSQQLDLLLDDSKHWE